MEGLCVKLFEASRKKYKMKRRKAAMGMVDSFEASHEGIKTVDIQKRCEFSGSSDLCIYFVTWNMNGKVPCEDIAKIVGEERKYDLLVMGLQEAPGNNILKLLKNTLARTHMLLGKAVMQSLQLYVFGPKNLEQFTREVKVDKHEIGGLGWLIRRKKGAVGVRIRYKGIQMVFISCHLSAHARNVEERNNQFKHISNSLFSKNTNPYSRPAQLTVWLGDLNYRLQGINSYPARDLIHGNLHEMLTSKDQLLQEAERGEIFNGYCEGALAFKPTYKYDIGSSSYDTSHKVRVPSWTDRILFKIDSNKINATLHSYEAIESIRSSDHKPVKAHLCLKLTDIQTIDPQILLQNHHTD
ncbi:PREDICTED: type IV inositol polyphosphate 5-phosphatase 11 [Nicotiana attenuata]|uniref:Type iv inositol polyphosphate 5-phosphatase 11 n=1 Tax=Nicotiana attenuata TaxID=49451 RepID=A0A1J6IGR9_NICAT|nr:PREDICTED: type IV inositol polyphosphate 5-phosphatase 11 [Nicotiana attenuata]OIT04078.1 type iv inositol polyphosphate 5-phosphatase 11 [Nicotiana attenuata]